MTKRASAAGVVVLVLAGAAGAAADEVTLDVRAPAGGPVACALYALPKDRTAGALVRREDGRWSWRPAAGQPLTCTSPGLEPVDTDEQSLADRRELRIELLASRTVTLETPRATEAVVEWRSLGVGGTALVARRRASLAGRLALPVASAEARVLRIRVPGLAPISVLVAPGEAPITLPLPAPQRGGEVFGALPAHAFVPETLLLTSQGRTLAGLEITASRVFQASGVAPGRYDLVPRYRGGILGTPWPIVVRAGETTERLPLSLPETGAVSVRVAEAICDAGRLPLQIALQRVSDEGRRVETRALFEQRLDDPVCDRDWEGLEEGTYQVSLTRASEPSTLLSAARFAARKGVRARVELSTAPVAVVGHVSYGADRAADGLVVGFELDAQTWSATTDAGGDYALALGPPGAYVVSVGTAPGLPSHSLVRTLQSGEQRVDLALGSASLHVRVIHPPGAPPEVVELTLTARRGPRLSTTLSPEDEPPARFVGLSFDEYFVTARSVSGLTSDGVSRVELTPDSPAADLDVVLARQRGRLRVVDERGEPLADARVTAGGSLLRPLSPGTFALAGIPAGEWLHVRAAGRTPVCRVLDARDLPELRLTPAPAPHAVLLHIASRLPWESGRMMGLPGSDCPVEMAEIGTVTSLGDNRTTVLLRAPRGQYQLAIGSALYPFAVPGQDVVVR